MKLLLKILSHVTALVLVVMLIIPHFNTRLLAPLTLAFPYVVILNVVMLLLLLLSRSLIHSIEVAAVLVLAFPAARRSIVVHGPISDPAEEAKELTVLTYNIQIFNNYESVEPIMTLIKDESPDILCMQEFGHYYNNRSKANNILHTLDSIYPYRHLWYKNQKAGNESGLVLYSKYPIINKQKLEYESAHNISVYSDIVVGDDTIRIVNNHLESNKLSPTERLITDNPTDTSTMKSIYRKIANTSRIRGGQADSIASLVGRTPYPVIVLGDFNDIPQSYTYRHILYSENEQGESLHDAYAEAGRLGLYHTYNQHHLDVPIDHILYTKPLRAVEARIIKVDFSDHYPVAVRFAIEN